MMAITHSKMRDVGTLIRAVMLSITIGAASGVAIGWQVELSKLHPAEAEQAGDYTTGRLLAWSGISQARRSFPIKVHHDINLQYPQTARNLDAAIDRVFVFPWPIFGALAGLGVLVLLTQLIDFIFRSKSK